VASSGFAQSPLLSITIHDAQGAIVPHAAITLESADRALRREVRPSTDTVQFDGLPTGTYQLVIEAPGFDKLTTTIAVGEGRSAVEAVLTASSARKDSITVRGDAANPLEQGPTTPVSLDRAQVQDAPGRPATVADALPLVPTIIRMPNGQLQLSGSGEHRSALLVNSSDATDPATGQFGATVPVDSVQTINVLSSPFLAQYGGFSSHVVSVETRKPGDKWTFELNDPLPEFRWRSWHMAGLRSMTPRISFGGPLIRNRLYLLEAIQYEFRNTPVITLPFPSNQQRREGYNSFTQLEYTVSSSNVLSATLHVADSHTRFANLDFFNPESVSPNTSDASYSANVTDHASLFGTLLESSLTATSFRAGVWAQGLVPMILSPDGNQGNYFNQQTRTSSRVEWREIWSLSRQLAGTHNLKFGSVVSATAEHALVEERPVYIQDPTGALLESITFTPGQPIRRTDSESGFFAQDQWTLGTRFMLSLGARAEQQEITETLRVAPRAGFVWTPFKGGRTVFRGGTGVFFDRVPLNVYGFSSYPEQTIARYAADGSVIYGPQLFYNLTEQAAHVDLPLIYRNARMPGNFAPYSTNLNIQAEQIFSRNFRLQANYLQSQSGDLIVLTPQITPSMNALVLSGSGSSQLKQLELTAAARAGRESQIYFSYVRSHATGNLNEFGNYLANFPPAVILPDVRTNLPGDIPNRFLAWGTVALPWRIHLMPKVEFRSGLPWSAVNVFQNYVGTPNQNRFPDYLSVDLRVSKDFRVSDKYTVRFAVSGSNLTDHFNPVSIHVNTADPAYGVFFGEFRRRYTADFDVIF
jgi:hypothetical protein